MKTAWTRVLTHSNTPAMLTAIFFGLVFSYHSIFRHLSFNSHVLDLGIYVQGAYLYSKNLIPYSSILQSPLLADHFGPIVLLLSPIYSLFPSAVTLLIIQALFVSISGVFIYLIGINTLKDKLISLLITLSYLSAPALTSAIDFDFHLATISVLPLSIILYAWHSKKWKLYYFGLIFSLFFKEDLPIFILGLGIILLIAKQTKHGIASILIAIASFYIIKFIVMPGLGSGGDQVDINTLILPLNDPATLLLLLFTRPGIFIDQIFNSPIKLDTIDYVLRQFGYLPIASPLTWLTVFPALYLRFSSSSTHFWGTNFHYNANLMPFLAVSTILTISRLKISKTFVIILLSFSLVMGGFSPNGFIITSLQLDIKGLASFAVLENDLQQLPSDVAVSAQSPLVPHIANRDKIFMYPEIYDAKYIVLNKSLSTYPLKPEEFKRNLETLKTSNDWRIVRESNGLIIFQKQTRNS